MLLLSDTLPGPSPGPRVAFVRVTASDSHAWSAGRGKAANQTPLNTPSQAGRSGWPLAQNSCNNLTPWSRALAGGVPRAAASRYKMQMIAYAWPWKRKRKSTTIFNSSLTYYHWQKECRGGLCVFGSSWAWLSGCSSRLSAAAELYISIDSRMILIMIVRSHWVTNGKVWLDSDYCRQQYTQISYLDHVESKCL